MVRNGWLGDDRGWWRLHEFVEFGDGLILDGRYPLELDKLANKSGLPAALKLATQRVMDPSGRA